MLSRVSGKEEEPMASSMRDIEEYLYYEGRWRTEKGNSTLDLKGHQPTTEMRRRLTELRGRAFSWDDHPEAGMDVIQDLLASAEMEIDLATLPDHLLALGEKDETLIALLAWYGAHLIAQRQQEHLGSLLEEKGA
jgi:hypothetical protein